jgi:endonuclease/exonuclease/phosphatase family metal-dependent hydrolase
MPASVTKVRPRSSSITLALALIVALAACGDTTSSAPADAGSIDAAVDASSSDDAAIDSAIPDASADADADAVAPLPLIDCPILDGGADAGPLDAGDAGTARIRVVASNLTSGTAQAYESPGIDILRGLVPDVVLFQEFNYKLGTIRQLVDAALGPSFCVYREPRTAGIPNGIASRFPIVDAGQWDDPNTPDRSMVWARIDIPGPVDLWAVSLHLHTASASTRAAEAQLLVQYVQNAIPSGDYLVLGGDLNTDVENEQTLATIGAIAVTTSPWPVDQNANNRTNASRAKPYDWVVANPLFDAKKTTLSIGASTYPNGLVLDSRVYTPLTEVPPVLVTDSAATNMQHMAVARDFLVGP